MGDSGKGNRLAAWLDNATAAFVAALAAGVIVLWLTIRAPSDSKTEENSLKAPNPPEDAPRLVSRQQGARPSAPKEQQVGVSDPILPTSTDKTPAPTNQTNCSPRALSLIVDDVVSLAPFDGNEATCTLISARQNLRIIMEMCSGAPAVSRQLDVTGYGVNVRYSLSSNSAGPFTLVHVGNRLEGASRWYVNPQSMSQKVGSFAQIDISSVSSNDSRICEIRPQAEYKSP